MTLYSTEQGCSESPRQFLTGAEVLERFDYLTKAAGFGIASAGRGEQLEQQLALLREAGDPNIGTTQLVERHPIHIPEARIAS